MPRPTIAVLPEVVIDRIAAGEVIERPSSVVRELLDNALDANATRVDIVVERGGLQSIQVTDDGFGMSAEDLPLAVTRFATSKIRSEDDLQRLKTFGFRGEALPSIAAVAKIIMESKSGDDQSGSRLVVEGGKILSQTSVGCETGTRVLVNDIFFSTPARRKFLKTAAAEFSRISAVVKRFALAHPGVTFRLLHDGKEKLFFKQTSSLDDRVKQVVYEKWHCPFLTVTSETDGCRLQAFLTPVGTTFNDRRNQWLFLNNRMVKVPKANSALVQAYRSLLMDGRFPGAIIYLSMPMDRVDVNVHPAKEEARFEDERWLHHFIYQPIRERLLQAKLHDPEGMAKSQFFSPSNSSMVRNEDELPGSQRVAGAVQRQFTIQRERVTDSTASIVASTDVDGLRFSELRIIGQVMKSYMVCEGLRSLVLIDQHAAHERVLFYKLRKNFTSAGGQGLIEPVVVNLSDDDCQVIDDYQDIFEAIGVEISRFGDSEVCVRALPIEFNSDPRVLIKDMVQDLKHFERFESHEKLLDQLFETLACHSAIRFGDRLEHTTMQALLDSMDKTDAAVACPHGRPVFQILTESKLSKMFQR